MKRLCEGTEKVLIDMIFSCPIIRGKVISKLTKMKQSNSDIIPEIHLKLHEISQCNSKLFDALRLIPEDPTIIDKIEEFKLQKSELKSLIKDVAAAQLKLKYLIRMLQSPESVESYLLENGLI